MSDLVLIDFLDFVNTNHPLPSKRKIQPMNDDVYVDGKLAPASGVIIFKSTIGETRESHAVILTNYLKEIETKVCPGQELHYFMLSPYDLCIATTISNKDKMYSEETDKAMKELNERFVDVLDENK